MDRREWRAHHAVPQARRARARRGPCQRTDAGANRRPGAYPARPLMRIAILVPAPDYPEPWRWTYDPEAGALSACGAEVTPITWTAAGDLSGYDLVLPLVVWGYHVNYPRWLDLLEHAERDDWRMINPPTLLRWNGDKSYLAEL